MSKLNFKLLIIDDEPKIRTLLARILEREGYNVNTADSLESAKGILKKESFPIIICDVKLPDGSGIEFIPAIKRGNPEAEVVMLTAYGNIPDGIKAVKNGAYDYLVKGDDNERIIPLLNRIIEKQQLRKQVNELSSRKHQLKTFSEIVAESEPGQEAVRLAKMVAPTDSSVLLEGPTGTGKEVFAQAIHTASERSNGPFVAVNCGAISTELIESELFGHVKGAFTGSISEKTGYFEQAHKGTLLLDEIGEMPLNLQTRLLRVLETSQFYKVGGSNEIQSDVRVIAATNRDLQQEIKGGRFREDLYFRLCVFKIKLSSLSERPEDIEPLVRSFAQKISAKMNRPAPEIPENYIAAIKKLPLEGNIRELRNLVERSIILCRNNRLSTNTLSPLSESDTSDSQSITGETIADAEKFQIQRVLKLTGGNKTRAAQKLGIGLSTLYQKIETYQIK